MFQFAEAADYQSGICLHVQVSLEDQMTGNVIQLHNPGAVHKPI